MKALLLSRRHRRAAVCGVCRGGEYSKEPMCARFKVQPEHVVNQFTVHCPQDLFICGGCLREGVRIVAKKSPARKVRR